MPLGICKNDTVEVISGAHAGKRGTVLTVDRQRHRALVEGVNMRVHHEKVNPQTGQGGLVQREAPIHLSNLALVCPKTDRPTRVRTRVREVEAGEGTKTVKERLSVRALRETGEEVVIPRKLKI